MLKRLAVLLGTICLSVALLSGPARADGDGGPTGGGTTPQPTSYTAAEVAATEAKASVVDAYAQYRAGTMSLAEFQAIEAAWLADTGLSGAVPSAVDLLSCPLSDPCTSSSRVLSVEHYGQVTNYHCGPAMGVMIAKYLAAGASAYDGTSLGQYHLGNDNHMQTNTRHVTSYWTGLFTIGLNRWLHGTAAGFYNQTDNPTVTRFRNTLIYDIDVHHPFGVSTVELQGADNYNFHDNSRDNIGHWIVARGYSQGGDHTYFADPATTVWQDTKAFFDRDTSNFVTKFVDNGISA